MAHIENQKWDDRRSGLQDHRAHRALSRLSAGYLQTASAVSFDFQSWLNLPALAGSRLDAELDVFIVRKLGLPGKEELAIGAIASGGVRVLNEALIAELHLSPSLIDCIAECEQKELERRQQLFRGGRPRVPVAGRTVIVVDDGLATGASMKAAAQALRMQVFPQPRPAVCSRSGASDVLGRKLVRRIASWP